ncbi:MAG: peptidylprolyl isomerase [Thermodesulfobacteriota bacterium]
MKRTRILALATLVALAVPMSTLAAPPAAEPEVLAQVGEDRLTSAGLEAQIQSLPPQLQAMLLRNPNMKEDMVNRWVQMTLLAKEAEARGLQDRPEFKAKLEEMRKAALAEELFTTTMAEQGQVTEAELKAYYDQNQAEFAKGEEVRAQHILVAVPEGAKPEDDANAKARVQEVQAALAKGEAFAALAQKYSDDPGSKAKGGDLGFFGRGRMVPEFEKAAFSTPKGKMSEPVRTKFGYHLIMVTDQRPGGKESFEEARPKIEARLSGDKNKDAMDSLLEKLKAKYPVTVHAGAVPPVAPPPVVPVPSPAKP